MSNERYDNSLKTYIIFLLGIAFLSFTAPWQKMSNFDPATGAFLRVLGGSLVLIPFAIREAKKSGIINTRGFWLSILAGVVLGIDFTAWNYSISLAGSGIASILLNIQILILPLLAFLINKEKIALSYYLVAPIMFAGVILAGGSLESGLVNPNGPQEIFGMPIMTVGTIAGLTSGVCYGIYLYASRRAGRIQINMLVVQPILISSLAQLIAPFVFAYMITGNGFDFTNGVMIDTANGIGAMRLPAEIENVKSIMDPVALGDPITAGSWFWMGVLCVLGQAAAWTFAQYGSAKLHPTLGAALLILSPIATVAIIAPVMFGEALSGLQITGVIVALLAIMYQNGLWAAFKKKYINKPQVVAE